MDHRKLEVGLWIINGDAASLDKEDDENVFMRKEFIYGTDARGEAFASFPHLIYGSFPA